MKWIILSAVAFAITVDCTWVSHSRAGEASTTPITFDTMGNASLVRIKGVGILAMAWRKF